MFIFVKHVHHGVEQGEQYVVRLGERCTEGCVFKILALVRQEGMYLGKVGWIGLGSRTTHPMPSIVHHVHGNRRLHASSRWEKRVPDLHRSRKPGPRGV